ncbi:hypothetical protein VCSRO12_1398 [Vibrio cholerae]|nr:DUF5363 family protein [Vibrio cholerae]ELQ6312677.1 DUF5363 family protein [Vibrio cholerae]WOQ97646.1 DUF5363 family protein [Vibrio cholerae]GHY62483.1 hypothetical protein VCSRO12_1398 [Vibrio cholerae]
MWLWLKRWIAKYDAWCQSMGLTLGQKRSCVPYRKDPPANERDDSTSA